MCPILRIASKISVASRSAHNWSKLQKCKFLYISTPNLHNNYSIVIIIHYFIWNWFFSVWKFDLVEILSHLKREINVKHRYTIISTYLNRNISSRQENYTGRVFQYSFLILNWFWNLKFRFLISFWTDLSSFFADKSKADSNYHYIISLNIGKY